MSVFRVNKSKDFTIMSNFHLKDKRLSFRTKGLLSVMLSLPDNWSYSVNGLTALSRDGTTVIESGIKELKDNGYLVVTKKNPSETDSGRFEYIYDVYEIPQGPEIQGVEKQGVENLPIENLPVENIPLNKNTNNEELTIKNEESSKESINVVNKKESKRFIKPTAEEVEDFCIERKNGVDSEVFFNHYESNGWMVGRNPMKDWKAAVRYWERSGYENEELRRQRNGQDLSAMWDK